jgi:drug/metabolite transporter (DMT)-like permease
MLFSAIGFALLAEMSYKYGDQNAVLMTRWITFSAAMLLVFVLKTPDDIPITYVYRNKKIALLLLVQGGLDVLAYISIAIGSKAPMGVVTIVIASTFGVITTLLARFILTESVSYFQWVGIGLIGVGVSTISYYSY